MIEYAASKVFIQDFTRYLNFGKSIKPRDQIETLVVRPGLVPTRLTMEQSINNVSSTPEECIEGSLCNLGLSREGGGSLRHNSFKLINSYIPTAM